MRLKVIGISTALLVGCNPQAAQNQATANVPEPMAANDVAPAAESNASAPAARTPLPEPKGPIDPKSVEAAGQVVQSYGALIEQHRLGDAAKLWGNTAAATNFAQGLPRGSHVVVDADVDVRRDVDVVVVAARVEHPCVAQRHVDRFEHR